MKKFLSILVVLGLLGAGGYYAVTHKTSQKVEYKTPEEADVYVRFGMEAYDSILINYWDDPAHYDLGNIFKLSLEKVTGSTQTLATSTRAGVAEMLATAVQAATSTDAKKNLMVNMLIVATYNLQPAGRSGLLSATQETQLRQTVSNINPAKDLYQNLGLEKGASIAEVTKAAEKKEKELEASTSPEAKTELGQVTYAQKVLTNTDSKALYDQNQIEPTVWATIMNKTLYLYISKISPTTFGEFARAVDNASTTKNLDSMILDLRGNVGGDLSFAQNFLGLFLGQNQYAFDLYRDNTFNAQRTVQPKFTELARYGEIALLTDGMTQSTAEVTAASFKRLHLGKTVGVNTRGWGTVENTYPLATEIDPSTKYTLLLVNSITMRDDNQPIEGRGVDPDVNITDPKWKSGLSNAFHSASLITALENTATKTPIQ